MFYESTIIPDNEKYTFISSFQTTSSSEGTIFKVVSKVNFFVPTLHSLTVSRNCIYLLVHFDHKVQREHLMGEKHLDDLTFSQLLNNYDIATSLIGTFQLDFQDTIFELPLHFFFKPQSEHFYFST